MRFSAERTVYLVALIIALLFLWQARSLDLWSILGPGPGLFPQLTTAFCCVVAALLVLFPHLAGGGGAARETEPDFGPEERRMFWIYCLAMPFLVIGSAYLGFILMSLILVMALTWFAERRGWRGALVYGLLCGLVGVVGFGHFLDATVPSYEIENFVLRIFH